MGRRYFRFTQQGSNTDLYEIADTTLKFFDSSGSEAFDLDLDDNELSLDGLLLRVGVGSTFTVVSGGDDVGVEGNVEVLGAIALGENASDPAAVANRGFVYTKDVSATSELFYEDDGGNAIQLTSGGAVVGADQNLWETMSSDSGSVAANTTTDTFTIAGSAGIDTSISGDALTVTLDLNEITTDTVIAAGDLVVFTDITDSGNQNITFANFEGTLNHDSLTGFVANEHIDHTSVTLTAGEGLSGGGTIAANRSFALDLNEITTDTSIAAGDLVAFTDITDSGNQNITFANFEGALDHGSIAGLSDDDHSQYTLVAGTRAFTGEQSMGTNKLTNVVDPTTDQEAATKKYVDDNIGSATKEIFIPMLSEGGSGTAYTSTVGDFATKVTSSTQEFNTNFFVPNDFSSLTDMVVIILPDATETVQWDTLTDFGAAGEAPDANSDSQTDATKAVTINVIAELDISAALTGLAANDYVGCNFQSDTDDLRPIGLRMKYA